MKFPVIKAASVAVALALLAMPAAAGELALKRVLLSSGGVAYYEYEAEVTGDSLLALDVRLGQVDDVLKSIVVFDDAGGVGAIRLPGREPVFQLFRDLPFDQAALASPVMLLNALKGAEVTVSGGRELSGRLIAAEAESVALPDNGGTTVHHRVSLLTGDGMRQFVLEEVDSVRFADPALQAQVERALAGLAAHRTRDRRTLTVEARGSGKRTLRVGYVVGAPLWKASYRLSLGDDGETGRLLGWAVVENLSGRDWEGVELTLASGNPVTFRQALYTAYFVHRPLVPVEVLGRVLPPADSGAVAVQSREMVARGFADDEVRGRAKSGIVGMMAEMEADMMMEPAMAPPPMPAPGMAQAAVAAVSEAAAAQVTFRIAEPVTVASGQSLLVPIIDAEVPAERLSLYQPATHARHPLASVEIENSGETGLPPGVLTLYRMAATGASYVGDARLASLPAGDKRLLSFALDQDLLIDREDGFNRSLVGGGISGGVLSLRFRESSTTVYRVKSSANETRQVVIEHPRSPGWELTSPAPEEAELTDSAYRLTGSIEAGDERSLEVTLERPVLDQFSISDMWQGDLEAYAAAPELSEELRGALEILAALRARVEQQRLEIERIDAERERVFDDQDRLRENLRRVPNDSDLYRRYLGKLAQQEDRLDALLTVEEKAQSALWAAEDALADAIAEFEI